MKRVLHYLCRRTTAIVLLAGCFCTSLAGAADLLVVGDIARPYFQSFVAGLNDSSMVKGGRHTVMTMTTHDPMLGQALTGAAAVVTVGVDAAQLVDTLHPPRPVLHAMVTAPFMAAHRQDEATTDRRHSALLLEQPISRYFSLFKVAVPERRRVGVIYGPTSEKSGGELRRAAARHGYELFEVTIAAEAELGGALAAMLDKVEILLATPDPVVVNANTAKTLILDTYLRGVALIGYSQAMAKAGAVMALYSSPEQLGQQAAALVQELITGKRAMNDQVYYPSSFEVAINYQIVRVLGMELPAEELIRQRVSAQEARQ